LIARASNCELQTQLDLSGTLAFGEPQLLKKAKEISNEVEKMLFALIGNLKNNSGRRETGAQVNK